ncbi:MAG: ATP-dependent Clp protease proteolytic subunit, partial [Myxococcales bacterium]|nr:ATP-dependent Clp protease proteolytic subunit [Myxococcales bacterium]
MTTPNVQLASKSDEEKAPNLHIVERLFQSRQIQLSGQVDEKLARGVISALLALEADDPKAPITIIVNSPG